MTSTRHLATLGAAGVAAALLLLPLAPHAHANPTRAGGPIVFSATTPGASKFALYKLRSGREPHRIGPRTLPANTSSAVPAADLTVSPDGTRIAFSMNRDAGVHLYEIRIDGKGLHRIGAEAGKSVAPAYSPDGSKVAFANNVSGEYQLYEMNADGTDPVQLTSDPGRVDNPSYAPDGASIVYETAVLDPFDLHPTGYPLLRFDLQTKTSTTFAVGHTPSLSPDGTQYLYVRNDPFRPRLTLRPTSDGPEQFLWTGLAPQFSPQGDRIAFLKGASLPHGRPGQSVTRVYTTSATGEGKQPLTPRSLSVASFAWAPRPN